MGSRGSSSGKAGDTSAPSIKGYTRLDSEVLIGNRSNPEAVFHFYEAIGESKGNRDHIVVYKDKNGINKRWYARATGDALDKAYDAYYKAHPEADTTRGSVIGVAETYVSPSLKK